MSNDPSALPKQSADISVCPQPTPEELAEMQKELEAIVEKSKRGEQLTLQEENKLLTVELMQVGQRLEMTNKVLNDLVHHTCAAIGLCHKGVLKIDKAAFDNFFLQYDAQLNVGVEEATGAHVIQVQIRPKQEKKILSASAQDVTAVSKSRIIVP